MTDRAKDRGAESEGQAPDTKDQGAGAKRQAQEGAYDASVADELPAPSNGRSGKLRAYLELARPANIVTAHADILAGFAAAGAFGLIFQTLESDGFVVQVVSMDHILDLVWLLLATTGLYGGGVVLNDVFDADLDAAERPERPIPSGRVRRPSAAAFGVFLLGFGVLAAAGVGRMSVVLALLIAVCAVFYDWRGKHHPTIGPLNMGLCRGGNLLLGMSAVPAAVLDLWYLALIPIAYIGAITAVSAGEVHGGRRGTGIVALILIGAVIATLGLLAVRPDYGILRALPFVVFFAGMVVPRFWTAMRAQTPQTIRRAVKAGVLGLVAMNAALAAGFAGLLIGLLVLLLLPLSFWLARRFAVT